MAIGRRVRNYPQLSCSLPQIALGTVQPVEYEDLTACVCPLGVHTFVVCHALPVTTVCHVEPRDRKIPKHDAEQLVKVKVRVGLAFRVRVRIMRYGPLV